MLVTWQTNVEIILKSNFQFMLGRCRDLTQLLKLHPQQGSFSLPSQNTATVQKVSLCATDISRNTPQQLILFLLLSKRSSGLATKENGLLLCSRLPKPVATHTSAGEQIRHWPDGHAPCQSQQSAKHRCDMWRCIPSVFIHEVQIPFLKGSWGFSRQLIKSVIKHPNMGDYIIR